MLLLLFILFSFESVRAACSNPTGTAGEIRYILDDVKFCDGTYWKTTTYNETVTPCTTEGEISYSTGDLRFCNGSVYVSMNAPTTHGSCTGTTVGTFRYNTNRVEWCDGTDWKRSELINKIIPKTLFTSGSAQSRGVAVDRVNNVAFVAESGLHRIAKYDLKSNTLIGWIGNIASTGGTCTAGVGQFTGGWCLGGTSMSGNGDGMFNSPWSVAIDIANNHLYTAEYSTHRIQKFNLTTGAFIGWLGRISTTGGTCTAGVDLFTGGWCSGGTSKSGTGDGMMTNPASIAINSTNGYLYVAEYNGRRIQRFNLTTGNYEGWIGIIGTTGGTCTAGVGVFTGGWCTGGAAGSGLGQEGGFNTARDLSLDITGNVLYTVEQSYQRVQKFNLATGAYLGQLGRAGSAGGSCGATSGVFTGGWCTGITGTTTASNVPGELYNARGIAVHTPTNSLYVGDEFKITKYNLTTGAFIGFSGTQSSADVGDCNAGAGNFIGKWCTGAVGFAVMPTVSSLRIDSFGDFLFMTHIGASVTRWKIPWQ